MIFGHITLEQLFQQLNAELAISANFCWSLVGKLLNLVIFVFVANFQSVVDLLLAQIFGQLDGTLSLLKIF